MSEIEARNFLLEFKKSAAKGGVMLVPRHDTNVTLQHLGITKRNLELILLALSVIDYCKGPKVDRDRPGEVWEFGTDINGYDIYIKLKVDDVQGRKIAKCISFHIAKYNLKYPYK